MGKRLEDLNLNDQPIVSTIPTSSEATAFLDDIESMRGCGLYDWADSTLRDIGDTVARTQKVTPGQRSAVVNIYEAGKDTARRRRIEGSQRRRWR